MTVFADASADAYAAVAYTRCEYVSGQISCHFVCAKTKVAPLTSTSIPLLELMAAVLAVQMSVSAVKVLEIPVTEVHFWTDSMNVLFWIRNRSRIFKPFVANRIGEIHRLTDPDQWRHVPTKCNPADIASRGTSISLLVQEHCGWQVPEFLLLPEECWPDDAV